MASGIYKIENTVNGKLYIGSAVSLAGRWRQHKSALRRGDHHNVKLRHAWKKHGADAFKFVTLEVVTDLSQLVAREQVWIDTANPYYNICRVAGSILGIKRSAETLEKMRGKKRTVEQRQNMSAAQRGKKRSPLSEEHKAKIKASCVGKNAGRKLSPEHCAAMAERMRGTKMSVETRAKMSAAAQGKPKPPRTDEHKAKIAATLKGRKASPETVAKRAAALTGKPRSEEARKAISEGRQRAKALRAQAANATDLSTDEIKSSLHEKIKALRQRAGAAADVSLNPQTT